MVYFLMSCKKTQNRCWCQTVRNGHIISCVLILFTSNEDQDSLYSSEPIHINLLQEKPEFQELQLSLDSAHEGDCNKPGETFTAC